MNPNMYGVLSLSNDCTYLNRAEICPCVNGDGHSGTKTDFCSSALVSPGQYHYTDATYPCFIRRRYIILAADTTHK
jgi:hypothetical protein